MGKWDLPRLVARVQTKLERVWNKGLTVGGTIWFLLVAFCFLVVAISPAMRGVGASWTTKAGWAQALAITWPALAAAAFLKFSETIRRKKGLNKLQRKRRRDRQILTAKAVHELGQFLRGEKVGDDVVFAIRKKILEAVVLSVAELLEMPTGDHLDANLLDFSTGDLHNMRVTCRSNPSRDLGIQYPVDNLVAWAAIRDRRISVVEDVDRDQRWEQIKHRPYRTIAAVPVTADGRAYGGLSLDSEIAYAFFGRSADIALQIEPYAAVLALTYAKDATYSDCRYDARTTHG